MKIKYQQLHNTATFRNVLYQCYVIGFWQFYLDKSQNYRFVIFIHFRIGRIANSIFDRNSLSHWIYRKSYVELSCQLLLISYSDTSFFLNSNLKLNTFTSFHLLWEKNSFHSNFKVFYLSYLYKKKTRWMSIMRKKKIK